MKIKQKNVDRTKVETSGWDCWGCKLSTFDWEYNDDNITYVFEGHVIIKTPT